MKIVLQRVKEASVKVDNKIVGKINQGLLLLVGIEKADTQKEIDFLSQKIINLRIFEDENDKMNRSCLDINGQILAVSQFTLAGSTKKGRRPSFDNSMEPKKASEYFELFVNELRKSNLKVETGIFGAYMEVSLINDGPVTFILE